ncbi:MAG TPA: WecB/TagA/CpsF family glycosyltransferase [Chloroflexia bacterium]
MVLCQVAPAASLVYTSNVAATQPDISRRVNILGVRIHNCDEAGAVQAIEGFLREQPARLHQVCTVNPEFVMEARRNPAFRDLLNRVDLATPDGVGIVAAARLLGTPVKGRATGVALVDRLARLSAEEGYSLFLLGAAPGVAEEAADALRRRYPRVRIAGTYAGSPQEEDLPDILGRLASAQPDVLMVAYGAPRQDMWIREHRDVLPPSIKVAMGVGGVFDYLSGRAPLAPRIVRRAGLEWLYRLATQPWRWRRILRVFAFAALALRAAIVKRET